MMEALVMIAIKYTVKMPVCSIGWFSRIAYMLPLNAIVFARNISNEYCAEKKSISSQSVRVFAVVAAIVVNRLR